jgi:hypothetical protein
MDYNRIYAELIERARARDLNGYHEKHHVVPRCMRGTNDPSNIVALTPEEHYIAHQLLVKIHPGHVGLAMALHAMSMAHVNQRKKNKVYGWVRRKTVEALSENMRQNNPNAGGHSRRAYNEKYREKHGCNPPRSEYALTNEGREAIRAKMTGDKNPMAGKMPWEHSRATDYTRSVWAAGPELYRLWKENGEPSYGRLYSLHRGESYTKAGGGVISPYMNVVKYFRNGWIPESS